MPCYMHWRSLPLAGDVLQTGSEQDSIDQFAVHLGIIVFCILDYLR